MLRLIRHKSKTAGLPPGTPIFTGVHRPDPATITVIDYNDAAFVEKAAAAVEDCRVIEDPHTVTWINVDGVHDVALIEHLGDLLGLHPLILEDLVEVNQRPKLEEYEAHLFIVLKMLNYDGKDNLSVEQVSLILGNHFVISFQEHAGDVFEPVRDHLRESKGRIRKGGADYLAYALIDIVVDHYFAVIEQLGERIETLEEDLLSNPSPEILHVVNRLKRDVLFLRKSVWPLREVISGVQRSESKLFDKKTLVYLRDVYDHTIQVVDMIETFRDFLLGLTDLYLSSLSQKMNEIMKFLTIIGTIFIPLTFIAGIYGMNFKTMPGITWRYGYPVVMGLMVLIGVALLVYFRRKRWI